MPDLAKRTATSMVIIGLTAYALFLLPSIFFAAEITLFAAVALYEFFTLLREAQAPCYRLFGVAMGIIICLIVYMELGMTQSGEVLFLVLGCFFLFVIQFTATTDNSQALVGIALTLFGILYVSWFLSFLVKIRFLEGGTVWVAYLVAVTKAGDIGGYLIGSLIGRRKLIPHISPKKSVEGLIGGLAVCVLVSLAFGPHLPLAFNRGHLIVLGLLIGVVGEIGDLSESLMKRFCRAKDSGRVFPGMGGALDLVDSVLFTAPMFYFHLRIFI